MACDDEENLHHFADIPTGRISGSEQGLSVARRDPNNSPRRRHLVKPTTTQPEGDLKLHHRLVASSHLALAASDRESFQTAALLLVLALRSSTRRICPRFIRGLLNLVGGGFSRGLRHFLRNWPISSLRLSLPRLLDSTVGSWSTGQNMLTKS